MAGLISVATLAQGSTLIPILWMMLWSFLTGKYSEDGVNRQERSISTHTSHKRRRKILIWRDRMVWWFQDEVFIGWGTKSEWIFAVCWTIWLCLLAAHNSDHGISSFKSLKTIQRLMETG